MVILRIQESFWRFRIPEHKLEVPVLVVGHVSEPRVAFDRPSLSFGKVLVGGRTHATINLVNPEHMPFQFDLDKASYDALPARLESTGLPATPHCHTCCFHRACHLMIKTLNKEYWYMQTVCMCLLTSESYKVCKQLVWSVKAIPDACQQYTTPPAHL